MYHYVEDKQFISNMRQLCGGIMQELCHYLKEDYGIGATFYLVGSGVKKLILQNANEPVDLDYNLEIVKCDDWSGRYIKECCRKTFNKVLNECDLRDCEDSTSSLTSKPIRFTKGNQIFFSIDICITRRDENGFVHRLIHEKFGNIYYDRYYWNEAPNSNGIKGKVQYIKENGAWEKVREQYLNLKNDCLRRKHKTCPSFICYVEAVNNVYNELQLRKLTVRERLMITNDRNIFQRELSRRIKEFK